MWGRYDRKDFNWINIISFIGGGSALVNLAIRTIIYFFYRHLTSQISPSWLLPEAIFFKPFDIPVYLISLVVISLMLIISFQNFGFKKFFLKIDQKSASNVISILLATLAFLAWISQMGQYPLANRTGDMFALILFVVFLLIILLTVFFAIKLDRYFQLHPTKQRYGWLIILVGLAIATFHPGFPAWVFDYSYFIGPAYQIITGHVPFNEFIPQYGLLLPFILAFIENLLPGSLLYLPVFVWVLYLGEYGLLGWIMYRQTRSMTYTSLFLTSLLIVNYFSVTSFPFAYPQIGPLRWLPIIAAGTLVPLFFTRPQLKFVVIFILSILSWLMLDSGLAIALGISWWLCLAVLTKLIEFKQALKYVGYQLVAGMGVSLIIQTLMWAKYGHFFSITVFATLLQYAGSGFGMCPFPETSYFVLIITTYIAVLISVLLGSAHRNYKLSLLAAGCLMMTGATYFMGRSHLHNLFVISPLWFWATGLLLAPWSRLVAIRGSFKRKETWVISICLVLLILLPSYKRQADISYHLQDLVYRYAELVGYKNSFINTPVLYERPLSDLAQEYQSDVQLINEYLPSSTLILAPRETYLFYLSRKRDLLHTNPLAQIISQKELSTLFSTFTPATCPDKIALDPRCLTQDDCVIPLNQGTVVAHGFLLTALEKRCEAHYQIENCNQENTLCIAQRHSQID